MEENFPKLPKTFKKKWLAALRSGEYRQTEAELCYIKDGKPEYCCLGVAGKICGIKDETMRRKGSWSEINFSSNQLRYIKYDRKLPSILIGPVDNGTLANKLAGMNDSGRSFNEIAQWIEENL